MKIRAENKVLDTFSFSSLTDIVLLLLIFFLLSSTFIIQPGIKVKLPVSDTAESTNEKSITITLTNKGLIYLNNKQISITELPAGWNQLMVANPAQAIIIRADKGVTIEQTVAILDIGKKVGATNFNIATEKSE
ncbi:MAG: biopolymer transporter ExbD [Candidatus Neomarinimicrobiota bacterium]